MLFGSIKRLLLQTRHAIDNGLKVQSNKTNHKTLLQTLHQKRVLSSGNQETDLNDEFNVDRQFDEISIESFESLATDDYSKQMIEKILYEYEYEKYMSLNVPKTLTVDHMKELLLQENKSQRLRYLNFLFSKERDSYKSKIMKKKKSEDKQLELKEKYSKRDAGRCGIFDNNSSLVYGLWHNTLFTRISKPSISHQKDRRLFSSVMFGQKLVIDLGYDDYMNRGECGLLGKQIKEALHYNKYRTVEPFDLMFTNCNINGSTMEYINRHVQELGKTDSFFRTRFFTQSYLDLFPRHELVYLSPDAKQSLEHFNKSAVYIIGGIVDKSCRDPLSYHKAMEQHIKCYKLPLDQYIVWGFGGKSMCINHMVQILHDVKHSGDWLNALRDNVPQRKQKKIEDIRYEDSLREQKLKRQQRIANMYFKVNSLKHEHTVD